MELIREAVFDGLITVKPLALHDGGIDGRTTLRDEGFEHAADVLDAALDVGALCRGEAGAFDAGTFESAIREDLHHEAFHLERFGFIKNGAQCGNAAEHGALTAMDLITSGSEPHAARAGFITVGNEPPARSGEIEHALRTVSDSGRGAAGSIEMENDGVNIAAIHKGEALSVQFVEIETTAEGFDYVEMFAENAADGDDRDALFDFQTGEAIHVRTLLELREVIVIVILF